MMFGKLGKATAAKREESETHSQSSKKSNAKLTSDQFISKISTIHVKMIKKHRWFETEVLATEAKYEEWVGFCLAPQDKRKEAVAERRVSQKWGRALQDYWRMVEELNVGRADLRAGVGAEGYSFAKAPIIKAKKPADRKKSAAEPPAPSKSRKAGVAKDAVDDVALVAALITCFRRQTSGDDDTRYANVMEQYDNMEAATKAAYKTHLKIVNLVREILKESKAENSSRVAETLIPRDVYGLTCVNTKLYASLRKRIAAYTDGDPADAIPLDQLFEQLSALRREKDEDSEEERYSDPDVEQDEEDPEGNPPSADEDELDEEEEDEEEAEDCEREPETSSWLSWVRPKQNKS